MNQNAEKLRSGQVDNMSRHVKSLSLMEETAGRRIDLLAGAYLSVLEELPGNFEKSCHEMAEIQVGLHNTLAKYRALQYQTEIRSAAQAAEEHLQIVRADLQSMLSRYENDYARRIDVLFSRFEKSAADIAGLHVSSPSPHIDRDRVIEKIREKFGDLRKAVIESAKEQVGATEATLDKACE